MVPELRRHTGRGALLALVLLAALPVSAAQAGRRSGRRPPPEGPPIELVPTTPQEPLPPIFLPGFEAQAQAGKNGKKQKGPAPIGPKPKPDARAPKPAPVDPMKAADEVTSLADHRSAQEEAELTLLAEHFRLCDLDGNGWLSLREAEVTLALGRSEYRRIDANQDGRLDPSEFAEERESLLARLGALPSRSVSPLAVPPAAEPTSEPLPAPARPRPGRSELSAMRVMPGEILRRYDTDQSKGIGAEELAQLLEDVGLTLSAELVVAQMDPDDSGQLEASELVAMAWMVSQRLPQAQRPEAPARAAAEESAPTPVTEPAPESPAARPTPAQTHFGRLDEDGDGFVEESDLRTLQSPARVEVRLRAILSALDQDGDGRLSEDEFLSSMDDGPR